MSKLPLAQSPSEAPFRAKVRRSGYVHDGIARRAGETIEVARAELEQLAASGAIEVPIRIRAIRDNVLVGSRVLALNETAIALSAEQAKTLFRYGSVEVLNAAEAGISLPEKFVPRRLPRQDGENKPNLLEDPKLSQQPAELHGKRTWVKIQAKREGIGSYTPGGRRGLNVGEVGIIEEDKMLDLPSHAARSVPWETPLTYPGDMPAD